MADYWVFGVDVHVGHVAFAAVKNDELRTTTVKCNSMETPTGRLMELHRRVSREALALSCSLGRPACIAVEEPIGRHRNPMLTKACGVAQVSLYETLRLPVWTLPPTEWKRHALGSGRASKRQIKEWADACGYPNLTEHEADAAGIAVAAAALLGAREAVAA